MLCNLLASIPLLWYLGCIHSLLPSSASVRQISLSSSSTDTRSHSALGGSWSVVVGSSDCFVYLSVSESGDRSGRLLVSESGNWLVRLLVR